MAENVLESVKEVPMRPVTIQQTVGSIRTKIKNCNEALFKRDFN